MSRNRCSPDNCLCVAEWPAMVSRAVPPVKGGGHYLLRLPTSSYLISAPGSAFPARLIYVHAGKTLTVDFPDDCK